jgi:arylsulfatase A-like enzyme
MKTIYCQISLLLLLSCTETSISEDETPIQKSNTTEVFLLSIDTFRPDCIEAYGDSSCAQTPNINGLAKDSVLYERAYSPISVTGPAFTTLMTGLDVTAHGIFVNYYISHKALAPSHTTLAEIFQQSGYQTAAFVSAYTLEKELGLNQGFEVYNDTMDSTDRRKGEETVQLAMEWIAQHQEPVFVWVHLFDIHGPLYNWLADEDKPIIGHELRQRPPEQQMISKYQAIEGLNDAEQYIALYGKAVNYVDTQVGLFIEYLKKQNRYDDALIVLVADHGETFTERIPWFDHGTHASVEQLHIPLIVKYPKQRSAGSKDAQLRALKDVSTTIVDVAGLSGWKGHGKNLQAAGWSHLLGESSHCIEDNVPACAPQGIRGKSFSYHSLQKGVLLYPIAGNNSFQSFDLVTDPLELEDLKTAAEPAIVETLERIQDKRQEQITALPSRTNAERESLERLGYISVE